MSLHRVVRVDRTVQRVQSTVLFKQYSRLSFNVHAELVPAFIYSLYLTLYKFDISLRWTLNAGPKDVRFSERVDCMCILRMNVILASLEVWSKQQRQQNDKYVVMNHWNRATCMYIVLRIIINNNVASIIITLRKTSKSNPSFLNDSLR